MKKWIFLIVLLAAGAGGYKLWTNWEKTREAAAQPDRPTTAVAQLRDIAFAVNAAGEISPAEQVSVRPEINGKIELLPVDIGDRVKKGELLFKLDDKELQQQRASNLTDIERAKLELQKAERDYNRAKELLAEQLISKEVYENTQTAYQLSKVALERSQRDLAIIEERLTRTEVRAPFDCTVLTRPVSIGQAVSGSGGFNSGTEVLTIADLASMIINAHVNQADVARLQPDQPVEVSVEAVPGLKVKGTIERIAPQATIKNNIKGYAARIVLKNVDQRIRPGMTANVKIPVASAANVTAVPIVAVYTERDPQTGLTEHFVYVQKDGSLEKRPVKLGVSDFFYAEIQDGLSPGEVVSLVMQSGDKEKKPKEVATNKNGEQKAVASTRPAGGGTNQSNATASTGKSATQTGGTSRGATPAS